MTDHMPLVLVPGLLCTRALWEPQISELSAIADVSVADPAGHATLREIAGDLLAAAPERFALAGLSMGGYIAFEVLRQAPERVERVAFLDTSARPDTGEQAARRRGLIELAQKGNFKGVTPALLPLFLHPDRVDEMVLVNTISAMAEDVGKDGFLRQQAAIMGRPDSRPVLPNIDCPAVVVVGRQDALTPVDCAEEIAAGIPGAELVVIEDCGHLTTLEEPEQTNAALRRWLAH